MKKSEILLDAIGETDDEFINDAHSVGKKKRKIGVAVLIAAALAVALGVTVSSAVIAGRNKNTDEPNASGTTATDDGVVPFADRFLLSGELPEGDAAQPSDLDVGRPPFGIRMEEIDGEIYFCLDEYGALYHLTGDTAELVSQYSYNGHMFSDHDKAVSDEKYRYYSDSSVGCDISFDYDIIYRKANGYEAEPFIATANIVLWVRLHDNILYYMTYEQTPGAYGHDKEFGYPVLMAANPETREIREVARMDKVIKCWGIGCCLIQTDKGFFMLNDDLIYFVSYEGGEFIQISDEKVSFITLVGDRIFGRKLSRSYDISYDMTILSYSLDGKLLTRCSTDSRNNVENCDYCHFLTLYQGKLVSYRDNGIYLLDIETGETELLFDGVFTDENVIKDNHLANMACSTAAMGDTLLVYDFYSDVLIIFRDGETVRVQMPETWNI